MRLNVWQRAGVVASVLWFIGGGLHQRMHDTRAAGDAMGAYYRLCTAANPNGDFKKCIDQADGVYRNALNGWDSAAVTAIGPIILGWLLAYLTIWIVRWVLAGRKKTEPS